MEEEEEPKRAGDTTRPRFHVGEYVILTQPYLGLPEGSVGAIAEVYGTRPPRYRIYFGESLPTMSFPQPVLAPLKAPGHRKRV